MRESVMNKVNYTLVIGDKEKESKSISYRVRGSEETHNISIEEFISLLKEEIKLKK